jgi:hypothetical protein
MIANGSPIYTDGTLGLGVLFFPLLGDVMMVVAEGLPIRSFPEQRLVTTVRHDVVDPQADAARGSFLGCRPYAACWD